jgi:Tfp pilus assembly protein PilV
MLVTVMTVLLAATAIATRMQARETDQMIQELTAAKGRVVMTPEATTSTTRATSTAALSRAEAMRADETT